MFQPVPRYRREYFSQTVGDNFSPAIREIGSDVRVDGHG
jgi:hypothetical protein